MNFQIRMHGMAPSVVAQSQTAYASPDYMCVRDATLLDSPWYMSLVGMLRVIVYIKFTSHKHHLGYMLCSTLAQRKECLSVRLVEHTGRELWVKHIAPALAALHGCPARYQLSHLAPPVSLLAARNGKSLHRTYVLAAATTSCILPGTVLCRQSNQPACSLDTV